MAHDKAKTIIEALLFASDRPLFVEEMQEVTRDVGAIDIPAVVKALNAEYEASERSFGIREIAGGYQMMTDPAYSKWIARLTKRSTDKLRGPSLETLAIIAYRQPITRGEIEAIRGVNVDGVLSTLEARGLIRTRGRKDALGRPILYGTTSEFLKHFGLRSIDHLPKLREFTENDLDFVKNAEEIRRLRKAGLHIEEHAEAPEIESPVPDNKQREGAL
ncbi:MAG: SMC-Scp complex subunit ScpB [Candidatus Omnitrophota bacterium]